MSRRNNFSFSLESGFKGYRSKPDKTASPERMLVENSQNVLINDEDKIQTREGYTLDGDNNSANTPNETGFTWRTSKGTERLVRGYDDKLGVRFVRSDDSVDYVTFPQTFSSVDFSFAPWWDNVDKSEILIFVNGDSNIYSWAGGMVEGVTYTSGTPDKLILSSGTWKDLGFSSSGSVINTRTGESASYPGGTYTTSTLNLTASGGTAFPSGVLTTDILMVGIVTYANSPSSTSKNYAIGVLNNQLYVCDQTSNEVSVSKDTSLIDFSFSSPRVPGDGELLVLDSPARAAIPLDQDMILATIDDDWYRTKFEQITVSTTLSETLAVKKLRTAKGKGLQSRDLVTNFGSAIIYVSNDNTLESIERPQDLETVITQNLSDPIKPDFDGENFTGGQVFHHKNRVYISAPVSGIQYILEFRQTDEGTVRFWQPPQILPIRRYVTVLDELYGLSSQTPNVFKLFDGTNDNGNIFLARAALRYNSYGNRALLKKMDEWFTEGYISSNASVILTLNFELEGAERQTTCEIVGGDSSITFAPTELGALGDSPLGDESLGILGETEALSKFRHILPFVPLDFFEVQAVYEMDSPDSQFEILACGGNVRLSGRQPTWIKKQITRVST